MKRLLVGIACAALLISSWCGPVVAWAHAGRFGTASGGGGSWSASGYRGGSASGGGGSWSGTGFRGGTASGGGGSWSARGYRGGTASGGGGSWSATGAYSGTAYHRAYYGGYYPAYHPPTTVNVYGSGCSSCGGWSTAGAALAGAAVGVAAGAAIASANTANATQDAYAQGYAAGSAAQPTYAVGAIYATLPSGCNSAQVKGATYYLCANNTWFKPSFGANGVYYRVVPTP